MSYLRKGSSNVKARNIPNFSERVQEFAKRRQREDLTEKRDSLIKEMEEFTSQRDEVFRKERMNWLQQLEEAIRQLETTATRTSQIDINLTKRMLAFEPNNEAGRELELKNVMEVVQKAWPRVKSPTLGNITAWAGTLLEQHEIMRG